MGRELLGSSRGTGVFALAVVLVAALGALSELPQARGVRAAATGALTPPMEAATWADGELSGAAGWLSWNHDEAAQNRRLREQNRRLAAQVAQLQATQRENAQLRSELALGRQDHLVTTGAAVVARDPDGLDRTFTIDRGERSGIRPGMAVVAGSGLVAVVRSVTARSAQVETIADPRLTIPVETATSGLSGTVRGGERAPSVRLAVTGQTRPQPGEGVVTAGGGGIPPGLPIGRLGATGAAQAGTGFVDASVTPFSDPAQASEVLVVRAMRS